MRISRRRLQTLRFSRMMFSAEIKLISNQDDQQHKQNEVIWMRHNDLTFRVHPIVILIGVMMTALVAVYTIVAAAPEAYGVELSDNQTKRSYAGHRGCVWQYRDQHRNIV